MNKNHNYIIEPIKKLIPQNIETFLRVNVIFIPKAILNTIKNQSGIFILNARMEKIEAEYIDTIKRNYNLEYKITELQQIKDNINEEFFPKTQYLELDYKEISLENFIYNKSDEIKNLPYYKRDGKDVFSFYIETNSNNIILTDKSGVINYISFSSIDKFNLIENNLPDFIHITDTLIIDNDFYVALSFTKKDCGNFYVYKAKLNFKKLNFKKLIFNETVNDKLCQDTYGGRMEYDSDKNDLYFTSYDYNIENLNLPDQNDGKEYKYSIISKINLNTKDVEIISIGHRNPQGLLITNDDFLISTEHGPRGGDEINQIKYGKNYGWPDVSYGEKYRAGFKESEMNSYKKDHSKYGYEEPIFSFVPSIGISQIIELDNSFSKKWQNNFILSSLRGNAIFRIKFDKKYNKILFIERMLIGKRIRDIKYDKKYKSILLALEDGKGSLGVIFNKNN